MISPRQLDEAIAAGAAYLKTQQQDNGSFLSYTARQPTGGTWTEASPTTFTVALVLDALSGEAWRDSAPSAALEVVRERAAQFLLEQCSERGTFNYWPRDSEAAHSQPYPDDLDDTFCSLSALHSYRLDLVSMKTLAAAVGQLTRCESEVGGPYYTWIVPASAPEAWRDVDLGVNCNVARFLDLQDVHLPRLTAMIEAAIAEADYATPYYAVSPYAVMYFIARFYVGEMRPKLQADLMGGRDASGWWGNSLDTALAVSALLGTGASAQTVEAAVDRLLAEHSAGAWPAEALYVERSSGETTDYAGAPGLTTALVLEALAHYASAVRAEAASRPDEKPKLTPAAHSLYERIVDRVRRRFAALDNELADQARLALERQLGRDSDRQMVLLPYFWQAALRPSLSRATLDELETLGSASLYGWICYTIYDDFLDEEGVLPQLSVAHVAMRELTRGFATLESINPDIAWLVQEVLSEIDAANTWEVLHCRAEVVQGRFSLRTIPDYGGFERLAGRSVGHALGPLCVLLIQGQPLDGSAMARSLEFFRHYLIARQLNDDAHDWEEDLARGQVNAVGALLLPGQEDAGGGFQARPLPELLRQLKRQLWQRDITTVCAEILRHTSWARQALTSNPLLQDSAALSRLLDPLERSVHEALQERARALEFITAYDE